MSIPTGDSRSISRNVFLCHSPSSHRDITRDKTAPHLSTLRLRGSFLNAEPIWEFTDKLILSLPACFVKNERQLTFMAPVAAMESTSDSSLPTMARGTSRQAQFTCIFIINENTIFYILDKYYKLCYNINRMKSNHNALVSTRNSFGTSLLLRFPSNCH